MEAEWYHLADRGEIMVNVTDLRDEELAEALAEIEGEFGWTGVESSTELTPCSTCDSTGEQCEIPDVTTWMWLLGATARVGSPANR